MSAQKPFGERVREVHGQHFRRFSQAVEREKLQNRQLSHEDYLRDARVSKDFHNHIVWPRAAVEKFGGGWRKL